MKVALVNPPFKHKGHISREESLFWKSLWDKRIEDGKYRITMDQIIQKLNSNLRGNSSDFVTFDLLEAPMWYVHLGATLSSTNINFDVIDLNSLSGSSLTEGDLSARLSKKHYDVYLLSSFTNNIEFANKIVSTIRKQETNPVVIMGGPHATIRDQELLQSGVDYIVRGEGEKTLTQLLEYLEKDRDMANVDGISYLKDGRIVRTPNRALIANLDELALPAYEILPSEYRITFYTRLFTSRGCPMQCAFCSDVLWNNQKVRKKGLERVEKEIDIIKSGISFVELYVSDDSFSVDRRYSMEVADVLKSANVDWSCETRVDMVTPSLLKHYQDCGCVEVDYGAESAVQQVLDKSNKKTKV